MAVFVLRQAGIPATDPAIRRGVAWLLSHQRASGRWFTRSVNNDKAHYISHAGTAFAVLALQACGVADAESGHQEPARHVQGPGERPGFKTFLQVNEGTVPSIAFSPDGKTLAAGYLAIFNAGELDGGLVLWDVATGRRLLGTPLPVKEGGVQGVAFSPDGKTLAAGYTRRPEEGGVVLWDAITRGRLAGGPLRIREGGVVDLAISPDGKSMVAAIVTHRISGVVLWDIATRKRLADKPLPVKEGHVRKVAFSADSKSVAASYSHGRGVAGVVLWDVATRQRLAGTPLPVEEGAVWGVAFTRDGKTLAAGYAGDDGGGVVLWEVATRKRQVDIPLAVNEGRVVAVAFSPDGETLAAGYGSGLGKPQVDGVALWDVATRSASRTSHSPRAKAPSKAPPSAPTGRPWLRGA